MNITFSLFYVKILFIVYFIHIDYCKVYAGDLIKQEDKFNILIKKLHSMYKDAFENDKTYIARRFFTKDGQTHYTLHVQKLKEVDGVKTHNLILEGRSKQEDPIIYINNPVEARMPNPFLSIDQFKNAMLERVEKQKKEFNLNRNLIFNANKRFKAFKHLENYTDEIFDIKKYMKQEVDVSNITVIATKQSTDKLMKTKGNRKENKKRAQKMLVSRTTKPTTKSRLMTNITLPKTTAHEETTTETTVDEEITTEMIVKEEITTETTADEEITTEMSLEEGITTETTAVEKITTEMPLEEGITTETTADEEIMTETPLEEEITTETTVDEEMTTVTTVGEDITTATIAAEEINTEPDTTMETTVKPTRTRQARPYVFMGGN